MKWFKPPVAPPSQEELEARFKDMGVLSLQVARSFIRRSRRDWDQRRGFYSILRGAAIVGLLGVIGGLATLTFTYEHPRAYIELGVAALLLAFFAGFSWWRVRENGAWVAYRNAELAHVEERIARIEDAKTEVAKSEATGTRPRRGVVPRRMRLDEERAELDVRVLGQLRTRNLLTGLLLAAGVGAVVMTLTYRGPARAYIGLGTAAILVAVVLQITRDRTRELEADRRQLDYEIAVVASEIADKPETLFLKHQFEVKRYYDQALNQGAAVFAVGIAAMVLGAAVAGGSLLVIAQGKGAPGLAAAVGAVGGIASDTVAVIFLRMHAQAIRTVREFHGRLVQQQSVHFANVVAHESTATDAGWQLIKELLLRSAEQPGSDKDAM